MSSIAPYMMYAAYNSGNQVKKADKILTEWAARNNLPVVGDSVAVATVNGMDIGFCLHVGSGRNGYVAAVPVEPASWSKPVQKALRKELKGVGTLLYDKSAGVVYVTMNGNKFSKEKLFKKFDTAAYVLSTSMPGAGVSPVRSCRYCKNGEGEEYVVEDGVCYNTHAACKEAQVQQILSEVAENEMNGNYLLATLCAVVGGIIGTLPTVLLELVTFLMSDDGTSYIFALLFALIPLGAAQGYKLGKGVRSGAMIAIVSVVSLLCTGIMILLEMYLMMCYLYLTTVPLDEFFQWMQYSMSAELFVETLYYWLFTIFGIAIAWKSMANTNKKVLAKVQSLQGGRSANPPPQ